MAKQIALIIGAGPAGLTAAYELVRKTQITPVLLEMTNTIGGISRTVSYHGNRIDIGGHRFFSKSDRVMNWWKTILPVQSAPAKDYRLCGRQIHVSEDPGASDPDLVDQVMLVRSRLSRILFQRRFYDYPITLNMNTLRNLGLLRILRIGLSYAKSQCFPIASELSLEDFLINRFGRELYLTFFRDYTEKVWGVPPERISPEWGAQRIKTLSIGRAVAHAIKRTIAKDVSLNQRSTETSLIEQFLYPKYGPGQLWETAAQQVCAAGGEILLNHRVIGLHMDNRRVTGVRCRRSDTGERVDLAGDFCISSMPVVDLVDALTTGGGTEVRRVAQGLVYRDFITVGLLLNDLRITNQTAIRTPGNIIPDNWIYVQEPDVKLCRLQVFNNWSPYMVRDWTKIWLGLEYFCNEGDSLWRMPDREMIDFAAGELARIGIIRPASIVDAVVIRVPKAYPAYFGSYDRFHVIREYVDPIGNLFLVGRNGMHRYNNQDHSMLSAMAAVENIADGVQAKDNLWAVNAEDDYHEQR